MDSAVTSERTPQSRTTRSSTPEVGGSSPSMTRCLSVSAAEAECWTKRRTWAMQTQPPMIDRPPRHPSAWSSSAAASASETDALSGSCCHKQSVRDVLRIKLRRGMACGTH